MGCFPSVNMGLLLGACYKSLATWDAVQKQFRKRLAVEERIYF